METASFINRTETVSYCIRKLGAPTRHLDPEAQLCLLFRSKKGLANGFSKQNGFSKLFSRTFLLCRFANFMFYFVCYVAARRER